MDGGGWRDGGWRMGRREERREGVLLGLGGMRGGSVVDMGDLISRG